MIIINNDQILFSEVQATRIGRYADNKCRPLRLKTKSSDIASALIAENKNIGQRSIQLINNLSINNKTKKTISVHCAHDKTKLEIKVFKELKAEIYSRKVNKGKKT